MNAMASGGVAGTAAAAAVFTAADFAAAAAAFASALLRGFTWFFFCGAPEPSILTKQMNTRQEAANTKLMSTRSARNTIVQRQEAIMQIQSI